MVSRGTFRSAPSAAEILKELSRHRNSAQASVLRRFFKTGPGEYGAGDEFWGLKVPQVRAVLDQFPAVPLKVTGELLASPVHEARFFAVAALVRASTGPASPATSSLSLNAQ